MFLTLTFTPMNTSRMLSNFLALILLLSASIGCEKTITEQVLPPQELPATDSNGKLAQLLEGMLQKGTPQEIDATLATYKSLSFEELELYHTLQTEWGIKRQTQRLAQAKVRLSQEQLTLLKQVAGQAKALRSGVNKRSMALYDLPYNQIADSLYAKLLDEESSKYPVVDMPDFAAKSDPRARSMSRLSGCEARDFRFTAYKRNLYYKRFNYYWTRRSNLEDPNDCDYEYRFAYRNYNFEPENAYTAIVCAAFGNRLSRRHSPNYTFLLIGNNAIRWPYDGNDIDLSMW